MQSLQLKQSTSTNLTKGNICPMTIIGRIYWNHEIAKKKEKSKTKFI